MIPKETPAGTRFWSWDWDRLWHAPLALVSDKNVAYLLEIVSGEERTCEVHLVNQSKAFLSEMEAVVALAEEALDKANDAMTNAFQWTKEVEKVKRRQGKGD